jgi:hypothetical protein
VAVSNDVDSDDRGDVREGERGVVGGEGEEKEGRKERGKVERDCIHCWTSSDLSGMRKS